MLLDIEGARFELKYRVFYHDYLKIINALSLYMEKDEFTKKANGKGYLVRSLYYDTDDYHSYHDKMAGNNERVKLRIRSYSEKPGDENVIRVELKKRKRNLVVKRGTIIKYWEYRKFMRCRHWDNEGDQILSEFENHLHSKLYNPKIIIEYQREAYRTKVKDDLRITFDHKVKSSHSKELFPKHSYYREHNPNAVVMEIKFKEELPIWIRTLVHDYGLKVIANSKFTQGIQASRHDLYHPGGVVVIR